MPIPSILDRDAGERVCNKPEQIQIKREKLPTGKKILLFIEDGEIIAWIEDDPDDRSIESIPRNLPHTRNKKGGSLR